MVLALSTKTFLLAWKEAELDTLLTKIRKFVVWVLAGMLMVVVALSMVHLGKLIAQEVWKPPRFLIPVQGFLEIFGYVLLVLIGMKLLEILKAYVKRDFFNVRILFEVALIAMVRKVTIEEPNSMSSLTLFGIAALILTLGIAFYIERMRKRDEHPSSGSAVRTGSNN
jgi:uncharacterized membrane protein (DUF373 family)